MDRNDRRILTLVIITGLSQTFAGSLLVVTLPFWRVHLGLTPEEASGMLALIRIGVLIALLFGIIGDRFGRRRPLLVSVALLLVANFATALVDSAQYFMLLQAVARGASTAVAALGVIYLTEEIHHGRRGVGLGVLGLATSIAGGLAYLLAPLFDLGDQYKWLFGFSALGLLTMPILIRFLKESRAFKPSSRFQPRVLFSHYRRLVPLATAGFLGGAFTALTTSFINDFLINTRRWGSLRAGLVIIGAGAIGSLGLLIGGRVADVVGRKPTAVAGTILGVVGGISFFFTSGWLIALGIVVGSFGASMFVPAFQTMRAELFPTDVRSSAVSFLMVMSVVGAITSLALGRIAIGELGLPLYIGLVGAVTLLSVPLLLLVPETRDIVIPPQNPGADAKEPSSTSAEPSKEPTPTTPRPNPIPAPGPSTT
jgi:MFS family permease